MEKTWVTRLWADGDIDCMRVTKIKKNMIYHDRYLRNFKIKESCPRKGYLSVQFMLTDNRLTTRVSTHEEIQACTEVDG